MALPLADETQRATVLADKDVAHMSRPTRLTLFWKRRDAACYPKLASGALDDLRNDSDDDPLQFAAGLVSRVPRHSRLWATLISEGGEKFFFFFFAADLFVRTLQTRTRNERNLVNEEAWPISWIHGHAQAKSNTFVSPKSKINGNDKRFLFPGNEEWSCS